MRRTGRFGKVMLRFRRWSRNPYAAFCSLGRNVTIGVVCRSIADASLKKTSGLLTIADAAGNSRFPVEDDDGPLPEDCPSLASYAGIICPTFHVPVFLIGGRDGHVRLNLSHWIFQYKGSWSSRVPGFLSLCFIVL